LPSTKHGPRNRLPAGRRRDRRSIGLAPQAEGIDMRVVGIREWTRENLHVIDGSNGRQYRIVDD
jgi:hypothetical protein